MTTIKNLNNEIAKIESVLAKKKKQLSKQIVKEFFTDLKFIKDVEIEINSDFDDEIFYNFGILDIEFKPKTVLQKELKALPKDIFKKYLCHIDESNMDDNVIYEEFKYALENEWLIVNGHEIFDEILCNKDRVECEYLLSDFKK